MKRIALTLTVLSALALVACDGTEDSLTNGARGNNNDPNATAGGEDSTFDHNNDMGGADPGAEFQPPEPQQIRVVGSPEITSRLHACGKLTVSSIGNLLVSRGLIGGGQRPANTQSGMQLYGSYNATTKIATPSAQSAAALGAPNYNGRVPEAPFASTSAMSKIFDIFTMASYDAVQANWTAPACPNVKVIDAGQFTKDGLSCLMGRAATDAHLAIANQAIADNATDGAKIAIAALLSAAHTCE